MYLDCCIDLLLNIENYNRNMTSLISRKMKVASKVVCAVNMCSSCSTCFVRATENLSMIAADIARPLAFACGLGQDEWEARILTVVINKIKWRDFFVRAGHVNVRCWP